MSKTDQKEAAPGAENFSAMMGRLDALQQTSAAQSAEMDRLRAAVDAQAVITTELERRFGQLVVTAPRSSRDPVPLTREQVDDILRKRPSAAFRLLAPAHHAGHTWAKGAIIRPQVIEGAMWRSLLAQRVQLEDADENP